MRFQDTRGRDSTQTFSHKAMRVLEVFTEEAILDFRAVCSQLTPSKLKVNADVKKKHKLKSDPAKVYREGYSADQMHRLW